MCLFTHSPCDLSPLVAPLVCPCGTRQAIWARRGAKRATSTDCETMLRNTKAPRLRTPVSNARLPLLIRRDQLIAARERPRPRDVEDVGVAPDFRGKRRERRRELHDAHRG